MQIGVSFSTGHVAPDHTFRKTHTPNVNPRLSKDNVCLADNLQGKTVDQYTNDKMQPIIDDYNSKQKRKDRRINDTYSDYFRKQPKNRGRTLSMEYVAQYGEHTSLGGEYYSPDTTPKRKAEIREEYIAVYTKLLENIKAKYPHMEILYAVVHFDEPHGTPHLHVGIQPIGEGYAKGLSKQVSVSKALSLDGIEKLKTRSEVQKEGGYQLARFYNRVRHEEFESLLAKLGYEFKEEVHGRRHEEPSLFVAGMEEVAAAKEQAMLEIEQAKETAMAEVVADRAKLEAERESQRELSEADVTPIPITPQEVKIKVAGKLTLQTETVSTVNPADVEAMERQLRATKMELESTKKERDELKSQASALKRIMDIILRVGTVFTKFDGIKAICREFPFFIRMEEKKRQEQEAAQRESQQKENISVWEPPRKRTAAEKQKGRQSRRNPWGLDIS